MPRSRTPHQGYSTPISRPSVPFGAPTCKQYFWAGLCTRLPPGTPRPHAKPRPIPSPVYATPLHPHEGYSSPVSRPSGEFWPLDLRPPFLGGPLYAAAPGRRDAPRTVLPHFESRRGHPPPPPPRLQPTRSGGPAAFRPPDLRKLCTRLPRNAVRSLAKVQPIRSPANATPPT